MKKLLLLSALVLALGTDWRAVAQTTINLGEMLFNSPRDMAHIKKQDCPLGYNRDHHYFYCLDSSAVGTGTDTAPKFTETVATVIGQPYVETVNTIPVGATVDLCTATTLTDVTSNTIPVGAGGYGLGVPGIPDLYARMTGTAGELSTDGGWYSPSHGNYVNSPRRITAKDINGKFLEPGTFTSVGTVQVKCWYRTH